MKRYKTVLTIAGSDSGGGAGIQADIKTISALGCFATSVITSLTAQNTQGVQKIEKINGSFVSEQIKSILDDIGADCIKIGMLQGKDIIMNLTKSLSIYSNIPVILDPVMMATSGDLLLEKKSFEMLKNNLFKKIFLLTPNKYEAETLTQISIKSIDDFKSACKIMVQDGVKNVLIKGGDFDSPQATDILYSKISDEFTFFETPRVFSNNTHGTGCTYSSAIASYIAKDYDLKTSISLAKDYIFKAIISGKEYKIGKGKGPVNHFWKRSLLEN